MDILINDIKLRIELEKLLFSDNYDYTKPEIKFMSFGSLKMLQTEECYMSIFYPYIPKLLNLYRKYNGEGFDRELYKLGIEVGKFISKTDEERLSEREGAEILYSHFIGLPKGENYSDFIKNRVMEPIVVKESFINDTAYELYGNNTNFLLTNNFFLVHYPNFYNADDIAQLKNIVTGIDKTKFETKDEYNAFKRAANQTINRIRKYEKDYNVKVKTKKY